MKTTLKNLWARHRTAILVTVAALCVFVLAVSLWQIITINQTYNEAENEYTALQQEVAPQPYSLPEDADYSVPEGTRGEPGEINPEYVGWLTIPGTRVDYPIAQGQDNDYYLNNTFEGTINPAGSIFMDYRVQGDFSGRNTILYGHNVKRGTMFGDLYQYLDNAFLAANPDITITTPDGQTLTWRIFAARRTDMVDYAYQYGFADDATFAAFAEGLGAPAGTQHMLTLSTCTRDGTNDERVLVHAALVE